MKSKEEKYWLNKQLERAKKWSYNDYVKAYADIPGFKTSKQDYKLAKKNIIKDIEFNITKLNP